MEQGHTQIRLWVTVQVMGEVKRRIPGSSTHPARPADFHPYVAEQSPQSGPLFCTVFLPLASNLQVLGEEPLPVCAEGCSNTYQAVQMLPQTRGELKCLTRPPGTTRWMHHVARFAEPLCTLLLLSLLATGGGLGIAQSG
jgi:hypothetical protein